MAVADQLAGDTTKGGDAAKPTVTVKVTKRDVKVPGVRNARPFAHEGVLDLATLAKAKEMGCDQVIIRKDGQFADMVHALTGGKGVDVALDCTAGAGTVPVILGIEALKRTQMPRLKAAVNRAAESAVPMAKPLLKALDVQLDTVVLRAYSSGQAMKSPPLRPSKPFPSDNWLNSQ